MGKSFEKLCLLFNESTNDKDYKNKTAINCFRNFLYTDGMELLDWKESKDNYVYYGDEYNEYINKIDKLINFDGDKVVLADEILLKNEVKDVISLIEECRYMIKELRAGVVKGINNLTFTATRTLKNLNANYIIDKNMEKEFAEQIDVSIKVFFLENYSVEYHKEYLKADTTKLKIELYNNIVDKKYDVIKLVSSLFTNYDIAKQACNDKNVVYHSNVTIDSDFSSVDNFVRIDLDNYSKYIDLNSKVSLIECAHPNIEKLFERQVKGKTYMVCPKAYFKALQDIKRARGKRKCWICGERLGLFNYGITCKKHNYFEGTHYV